MKTRSQTRKEESNNNSTLVELYEVNIDFDEASKAWKQNKKSIGNGYYKYICSRCGKSCYKMSEYCWIHRNTAKTENTMI